jgi:hypothetical protein
VAPVQEWSVKLVWGISGVEGKNKKNTKEEKVKVKILLYIPPYVILFGYFQL